MLSTDQKGNIAEAAIALAATRLHIDVYRPLGEGGSYDLILDLEDRLLRVQCKWAPRDGDVVVVRCYSTRRSAAGFLKRTYSRREIDAFGVYCADLDSCYLLPIELFDGRSHVSLRLGPTRNNQQLGVNWASEYEFGARLRALGAVAQLGERLAGSQ